MNRKYFLFVAICLWAVALVPWSGAEPISILGIGNPKSLSYRIFWELRIPRLLVTLSLGGILASIGSAYQSIFRNPLCEPYILGVSSAVLLGVVIAETFFHQKVGTPISFLFGLGLAMVLIFLLIVFTSSAKASSDRVILFGLGANFVLSAALFLLLSVQTQSVGGGTLKWFFGFLPWLEMTKSVLFFVSSLLFLSILIAFSRPIDALRLGDSVARTLGVSPTISRNAYLVFTSLVVATTVSVSGTIGFVGLVIPQVCRIVFRPASMRLLLAQSFFLGAVFLSVADGISRSILPPFEFPVGVITTLIGGPLFLITLWKKS
ncbi:MAG: iron ABC transporter permease [Proteobacteria bacterium]|nr:iron ABC transporter permease [Pseudomonadota bacterium]